MIILSNDLLTIASKQTETDLANVKIIINDITILTFTLFLTSKYFDKGKSKTWRA
jgi:hypothetical protein